jgi:hypothetical protein
MGKHLAPLVGRPVSAGSASARLTNLDNSHHMDGGGKHPWAVDGLGVDIIA